MFFKDLEKQPNLFDLCNQFLSVSNALEKILNEKTSELTKEEEINLQNVGEIYKYFSGYSSVLSEKRNSKLARFSKKLKPLFLEGVYSQKRNCIYELLDSKETYLLLTSPNHTSNLSKREIKQTRDLFSYMSNVLSHRLNSLQGNL
jgi:hypothetical protein